LDDIKSTFNNKYKIKRYENSKIIIININIKKQSIKRFIKNKKKQLINKTLNVN